MPHTTTFTALAGLQFSSLDGSIQCTKFNNYIHNTHDALATTLD